MNFVSVGTTFNYSNVIKILKNNIECHLNPNLNSSLTISFFINDTADIFMSHGCADKNYMTVDKLKKFKYIFVPGPWLKKKLVHLGISSNIIFCVGWPKIDPLFSIIKKTNPDPYYNILWAPSHSRGIYSYSSYPKFMNFYKKLIFNNRLVMKSSLHPRNNSKNSITEDQMIECQYIIADYGSTLYEAWALGIPVIFPDWIVKKHICQYLKGSTEQYIYKKGIGLHATSYQHMVDIIFNKNNLVLDKKVIDFMKSYLPSNFNGKSGQIISNIINKINLLGT